MNDSILVFNPSASGGGGVPQSRRHLDTMRGKVVGFIDNAKPNFNHLVDDLAELLISRYGAAAVVKRRKRSAAIPAPEEIMNEISERCDAVITGSGD